MLPLIAELYPELHNKHEQIREKRQRLQAELADADEQLAEASEARSSTARWMLQCAGGAADGQNIVHDIAAALMVHGPAAAASFLEAIAD